MTTTYKTYRVVWEIDIDAPDPRTAAQIARGYQRDREARVGVFSCTDEASTTHRVDLDDTGDDL